MLPQSHGPQWREEVVLLGWAEGLCRKASLRGKVSFELSLEIRGGGESTFQPQRGAGAKVQRPK
jgi:hypothetical protein